MCSKIAGMDDHRKRIHESAVCYDEDALEVLCQIAEKAQDCDRIIKEFKGKLAVLESVGFSRLSKPHKITYRVLGWLRYIIADQGIDLKDVTAGAFMLVLKENENDGTYDFEALFNEIRGWAKREFGIDLIFSVVRNPTQEFNDFNFVVGLSGDINDYKNKIQLWHKE